MLKDLTGDNRGRVRLRRTLPLFVYSFDSSFCLLLQGRDVNAPAAEFQFDGFIAAVLLVDSARFADTGIGAGDDVALLAELTVSPLDLPAGQSGVFASWAVISYRWRAVTHLPADCLPCPEISVSLPF